MVDSTCCQGWPCAARSKYGTILQPRGQQCAPWGPETDCPLPPLPAAHPQARGPPSQPHQRPHPAASRWGWLHRPFRHWHSRQPAKGTQPPTPAAGREQLRRPAWQAGRGTGSLAGAASLGWSAPHTKCTTASATHPHTLPCSLGKALRLSLLASRVRPDGQAATSYLVGS